jgi:hypothetical protein
MSDRGAELSSVKFRLIELNLDNLPQPWYRSQSGHRCLMLYGSNYDRFRVKGTHPRMPSSLEGNEFQEGTIPDQ